MGAIWVPFGLPKCLPFGTLLALKIAQKIDPKSDCLKGRSKIAPRAPTEFKNKKFKTSAQLCDVILKETGVAMLPGSDFGFKPKKMLTRLSYTDFDGVNFFKNVKDYNSISEEMVKTYAPNVVEGTTKLSNWAKNL